LLKLKVTVFDVLRSALANYCQGFFTPVKAIPDLTDNITTVGNTNALSITQLCVAYSGGLDSTVLLDVANQVCKEANIVLTAFHINHGISTHAQKWQAHCQTQCERRKITFNTQSITLQKSPQKSLEAQARDARYQILDNYAGESTLVLLAQHEDDQAETFLLQLKRGAGLQGLSGMPMLLTKPSGTHYMRPFLKLTRADLLTYAKEHNLKWIEDESNLDDSYDRNFLRNQIVPRLALRWPAINKTIARSAFNCAQAQQVNTEYMKLLAKDLLNGHHAVNIEHLLNHSPATQHSFMRHWLSSSYALTLSSIQLSHVLGLTNESNNASPYIELAGVVVERFQGQLQVIEKLPGEGALITLKPIKIDWGNGSDIRLNQFLTLRILHNPDVDAKRYEGSRTQIFRLPKDGVTCVFGGSNLSFKCNPKRPTKKLKVLYQEWQISPLQRLRTPVFAYGATALAVGLSTVKVSCGDMHNEITVALVNTPT
jgi:tRNA(Ile)-lysidine synthase